MSHLKTELIEQNNLWLSTEEQSLIEKIRKRLKDNNLDLCQFTDQSCQTLDSEQYLDLVETYFAKLLAEEIAELKAVLTAQSQIEIGLYGICPYCESEISEDELKINPAVQSCNDCNH